MFLGRRSHEATLARWERTVAPLFQGLSVHANPSPGLEPLVLRDELVLWEEAELDESYNTRPEQGQQTFSLKSQMVNILDCEPLSR